MAQQAAVGGGLPDLFPPTVSWPIGTRNARLLVMHIPTQRLSEIPRYALTLAPPCIMAMYHRLKYPDRIYFQNQACQRCCWCSRECWCGNAANLDPCTDPYCLCISLPFPRNALHVRLPWTWLWTKRKGFLRAPAVANVVLWASNILTIRD